MSLADNKDLVRRWYEEVVGTGDLATVERYVAPEYVEFHRGERHASGLEGARRHVRGVRDVWSDLRIRVDRQIAEGEWVATLVTVTGIHRGGFLGMEPTGVRFTTTAVNLDRVVDGRIVEHGGAANLLEPFLESGAVRAVGRDDG